jgi:hypothetical protein
LKNSFSGQHVCLVYYVIGNIQKDIRCMLKPLVWIPVWLSACPLTGTNNGNVAWHSVVGTVLSLLPNFDITGPSFKWNCADGLWRQHYPLFAALVSEYTAQVTIAQDSF